jgi:uncharacterized membrane protein
MKYLKRMILIRIIACPTKMKYNNRERIKIIHKNMNIHKTNNYRMLTFNHKKNVRLINLLKIIRVIFLEDMSFLERLIIKMKIIFIIIIQWIPISPHNNLALKKIVQIYSKTMLRVPLQKNIYKIFNLFSNHRNKSLKELLLL